MKKMREEKKKAKVLTTRSIIFLIPASLSLIAFKKNLMGAARARVKRCGGKGSNSRAAGPAGPSAGARACSRGQEAWTAEVGEGAARAHGPADRRRAAGPGEEGAGGSQQSEGAGQSPGGGRGCSSGRRGRQEGSREKSAGPEAPGGAKEAAADHRGAEEAHRGHVSHRPQSESCDRRAASPASASRFLKSQRLNPASPSPSRSCPASPAWFFPARLFHTAWLCWSSCTLTAS